jgi:translation initiation factor IF-2
LRKSIQSLFDRCGLSMHELVHHTFHSKLLSTLRRPTFAGTGLPERMRSISFALLGLTAAAGLCLVAVFAQPGFPLLAPAPLPDEPTASESISRAERLPFDRTPVAVLPARPAHLQSQQARAVTEAPAEDRSPSAGGSDGGNQVAPAAVETPARASEPGTSGGSGGAAGSKGGGSTGGETGGGSDQTPTSAPAQSTAPPSAPVSSPHPTDPKPEAIASAPKPEPDPAPGNSSSAAASEHASERGIEASASAGTPPSTAASAPEAAAPPGNGNGLAKGHDK